MFDVQGDNLLSFNGIGTTTFNNSGELIKSTSTGESKWKSLVNSSGTIRAQSGVLNFDGVFTQTANWQLDGLHQLYPQFNGALLATSQGDAHWFADDGSGGYLPAVGDPSFSTLVQNVDQTYTLTTKQGDVANFSSLGLLTSIVDPNGNTYTFTYIDADSDSVVDELSKIADPFSREHTFTYTSGLVTSITDFAGRTVTLAHTSGDLTSVTQEDPDDTGPLTSPAWNYGYDAATGLLDSQTNPLNYTTQFAYSSTSERLSTITHPDSNTITITPIGPIGLPTGTTGQPLSSPSDAQGSLTNERSKTSTFNVNRFGSLTDWSDPLNHQTQWEYNLDGQPVRLIEADPDSQMGPLISPITKWGYTEDGDLAIQYNPDDTTLTWTYETTFHQILTQTDELGRTWTYTYDTSSNRLTEQDPAGKVWIWEYNSRGQPTKLTTPTQMTADPLSPAYLRWFMTMMAA